MTTTPPAESPLQTTHLLYLHGFRSSPQSHKARMVAHYVAQHHPQVRWLCPQLPPSPKAAMALVRTAIQNWPVRQMAVVGSSLGGFYATYVAETLGCTAVVLNPAVSPSRDLEKYIGEQTSWHDPAAHFYFAPEYVQELSDLQCGPLSQPERYMAVIAKGDELLDWREMHNRYSASHLRLLDESDHALSDFDTHIDAVMDFLQLA
ncbi:YqiA/YcfP family alpha/beta fold hydrolase [Rhodoferax aquaticus]|uniref:Esterase n=1 Tax=Rhodoferax aquaticus TaxID=2527691 RepID=A0A515ELS8_9BURK|nr:YqiA/YcfP family alpha/beta fold hydrolase [Rhodoferax aquaticus]QDL53625.1 esterase [Rhodoferax aquaticus]